jgi:hypothetical protein
MLAGLLFENKLKEAETPSSRRGSCISPRRAMYFSCLTAEK